MKVHSHLEMTKRIPFHPLHPLIDDTHENGNLAMNYIW